MTPQWPGKRQLHPLNVSFTLSSSRLYVQEFQVHWSMKVNIYLILRHLLQLYFVEDVRLNDLQWVLLPCVPSLLPSFLPASLLLSVQRKQSLERKKGKKKIPSMTHQLRHQSLSTCQSGKITAPFRGLLSQLSSRSLYECNQVQETVNANSQTMLVSI